jgi:hypothetical protein
MDQVLEIALSPEVVAEPPRPRKKPDEQDDADGD